MLENSFEHEVAKLNSQKIPRKQTLDLLKKSYVKCNLRTQSPPHLDEGGREASCVKFVQKVILWPASTFFWKNIEVDSRNFKKDPRSISVACCVLS